MADNDELAMLFYVQDSGIHGQGLFSRIIIDKGAYLGTYDGPVVENNDMHVLWVEDEAEGKWIGRDGKNLLRYINHSNNPIAEFNGFELYAISEIEADAEITIDYGEEP